MPQNLQAVADELIVRAAIAFRNESRMPMLVNRDYDAQAQEKNDEIKIPIYAPMTIADVVPGTPSAAIELTPDTVSVKLDQWKESRWLMTDKEMAEVIDSRVVPEAAERAINALGDAIDLFCIRGLYRGSFSMATAASPATEADVIAQRKVLNILKAPRANRRLVVSDTIEAELLARDIMARFDARGDTAGLIEASLGRKYQFDLYSNGQLPLHTAGNPTGWTVTGAHAAQVSANGGTSTVVCAGTGAFLAGDRLTFAGHSQTYVVVSIPAGGLEVAPRLQAALINTEVITITNDGATHQIGGLAFHRNAFVFALRPLSSQGHPAVIESVATDPVTGVTLRLEVVREHKRNVWQLDVLWGGKILYPEAVSRLKD